MIWAAIQSSIILLLAFCAAGILRRQSAEIEASENLLEVEFECGQDVFATDVIGILEAFRGSSCPIDIDASFYGIQQPTEPGAVLHVFGHLPSQVRKPVRW